MSALMILPPLPIAGITATRGSGAANLMTPHPNEVWADATVGSAASINVDLGGTATIDTIFLGHVRPAALAATWQVSGGVAGPTEKVLVSTRTLRVPDIQGRTPALSHALASIAATAVRYLRIDVTQPAGSQPLTIGALVVGRAWSPSFNHEWGSGRRPIDTGTSTALPDGTFATVQGVRKTGWSWTLGDLTDIETDILQDIALQVGETNPLVVVEDPAATTGLRRRIHYSRFVQLRAFERAQPGRTRWELSCEEWGADDTTPLPGA